jgi:hypothetical protein
MDYRCALSRYDEQRDPDDHVLDKVPPQEIGAVHAVPARGKFGGEYEYLPWYSYERAMCGRTVKVLMPILFDPGDPDACRECVDTVLRNDPGR